MTKRRTLVSSIAATAVALVVAGLLVLQLSGARTTPAASPASPAAGSGLPTSAPAPGSSSTAQPDAVSTPLPTPRPPSTSVPAPRKPADAREADPVAPGDPTTILPPSKPLPALVTLPLPDTSSAVGSIVAGFPSQVIPSAPHSSVATTSVAVEGSHLQAALTAQTTLSVVEVMDFYRTALAKLGLFDTPAPALDGSSALAFNRGNNTVTLTATTVDGGSRYVVFGTFSAQS